MELPDRIKDMTREQRIFLDNLVDQVDAEFSTDRMDEERLAKDPHLAILPSGRKISTKDVLHFDSSNSSSAAWVYYSNGSSPVALCDEHDIAAFNAALNDIGVYVAAPTLKGDDADGDGINAEGAPV